MAATYHWTPRYIERELTDELLVLYLDEETDRVRSKARGDFDAMVEAVRAGSIFARNDKPYQAWRRSRPQANGQRRPGLVGAALEAALMGIRALHPDIVTVKA